MGKKEKKAPPGANVKLAVDGQQTPKRFPKGFVLNLRFFNNDSVSQHASVSVGDHRVGCYHC